MRFLTHTIGDTISASEKADTATSEQRLRKSVDVAKLQRADSFHLYRSIDLIVNAEKSTRSSRPLLDKMLLLPTT